MSKFAFWNNGAPRLARVTGSGNRRRLALANGNFLSGRIVADVAIDLYAYEIEGPTPGLYQRAGASTFDKSGTVITETRTVQDFALEDAKAAHKVAATTQFRFHRDAGIDLDLGAGAFVVATTHDARQELAAVAARLASSGGTQAAVTRGGLAVQISAAAAAAMLAAVDDHHAAVNAREYALYEAIDAAEDVAAVRAIDVAAGWPALPESGA